MVRTVLELEPDVVVFDIHLPRLNGLDALRQIYQERIVAAVAITADRDQELVRRALEEHVLAYLVKPVEEHQLGPALMIAPRSVRRTARTQSRRTPRCARRCKVARSSNEPRAC